FFFFQAEDGIRDLIVTGVQTCALPIWMTLLFRKPPPARRSKTGSATLPAIAGLNRASVQRLIGSPVPVIVAPCSRQLLYAFWKRSEERRVGKECRYWWWG